MFTEQLAGEIAGARTLARLDMLARLVWQGWGSGAVVESDAQQLAEAVQARKVEVRGTIVPVGIPAGRRSIFKPRRAQGSPDRARSRERRRRLAFSGPMPPALAAGFTTGELAALRIIGDAMREHGCCALPIAAIAARAGVGRTTVQNAIRQAAASGLLTIQERRRQGKTNLSNVIRLVSREWIDWLRKGRQPAWGGGFKKADPTDRYSFNSLRTSSRTKEEFDKRMAPQASRPSGKTFRERRA